MGCDKEDREFIADLAAQGLRLGEAQCHRRFTSLNEVAFVRFIRQEPSVAAGN
jgi:hypothetical protein